MSKAPERIWAFAPDIFDNCSLWQDMPSPAGDTIEYVRAARIEELEAKLAKAVQFTEGVIRHAGNSGDDYLAEQARTTLAELTGGKNRAGRG